MIFKIPKLKGNRLPPLKSLRPVMFDTDYFWFLGLSLFALIFVITAFVGFNFFYSQYFETFKKTDSSENFDNIINVERLKKAVEKRADFINSETALPKDPSV